MKNKTPKLDPKGEAFCEFLKSLGCKIITVKSVKEDNSKTKLTNQNIKKLNEKNK